jgi:NAD(P)H-flavin reductase
MSLALARDPMLPVPYRVTAVRHESADVVTMDLVPLAAPLAQFAPGQFNMVYVFGIGEVPISVSGDPADHGRLVHTVRGVGAVSAAMIKLPPGTVLGLRGPYGTSWPMAAAEGRDVLIVAGGLGIAPLRPAIYRVLAESERYGRITILYGARRPADFLFQPELTEWRARLDVQVALTVDQADRSWHGSVGVVPSAIGRMGLQPDNLLAMICGPEVMMRFSVAALRGIGLADDRIYISMERNMKCALGLCGHCQFGPDFVCRDGAVMRVDHIGARLLAHEV